MLDMARTREVFETSTDFTLAVEEEFQLLDPETLDLTQRYTELRAKTDEDPVLAHAVAGELIESEIEIRSGRCESWGELVSKQQEARNRLFQDRVRFATRNLDNSNPLRAGRKRVARVLTLLREAELKEQTATGAVNARRKRR